MLVLGLVAIFAAISALVLGLLWREPDPLAARMASLRGERLARGDKGNAQPEALSGRVLGPLADAIVGGLTAILPTKVVSAIDRRLVQAGQPVTLAGFLTAVVLVEGTMLAFGLTLAMSSGGFSGKGLFALIACAALGLFLPRVWLESRVRQRQHEVLKSLPDAFDLITTCVEAGLGLDAALAKVAEKVEGPFAEELALSLREVSLGRLRREALKELAERSGVPDLAIFINAVIQAETMGTSIASVLRIQAEQMRTRRRQRAEQQAYKAPVKMIFPLVLCIFPTLFIVILGPAAIILYQTLVQK